MSTYKRSTAFLDVFTEYALPVLIIALWAHQQGILLDSLAPGIIACFAAVPIGVLRGVWTHAAKERGENIGKNRFWYYLTLAGATATSAGAGIALYLKIFA